MKIKQGKFTNSSGSEIPAFGVFRVSASVIGDDGSINVTAKQPDGSSSLYYVNQSSAVADTKTGSHYTEEDLFPVLYDETEATPVPGDLLGPQGGSFKASSSGDRWRVVYGDTQAKGFVICRRHHGSGSSKSATIRFTILSASFSVGLGVLGCDFVNAKVTHVSCGYTGVAVGDEVHVFDPEYCHFNLPIELLVGLSGTATLMDSEFFQYGVAPLLIDCQYELIANSPCMFMIDNLCCSEEVILV